MESSCARKSNCDVGKMHRATAVDDVEVYDSPASYGRAQQAVANDMLIIGVPDNTRSFR